MNAQRFLYIFYGILLTCAVLIRPTRTASLPLSLSLTCTQRHSTNVCCRPAKWTDLIIFYLGNYITHAGTAKGLPGQSPLGSAFIIVTALLFPMSGAIRGVRAIFTRAVFADTELQTAARAGALCMVVEDPYVGSDNIRRHSQSNL